MNKKITTPTPVTLPELTTEQKLALRSFQVNILISQGNATRAAQQVKDMQTNLYSLIEGYYRSIGVDSTQFSFDLDSLTFTAIPQKQVGPVVEPPLGGVN